MRSQSRYRARSISGGSTKGMNSRAYAAREMPGTASGRCSTSLPSVVTQWSRTSGWAAAAAILSRFGAVIPMSHRYRSSPRPGVSWETTDRTVAANGRLKRSSAASTVAIQLSAMRHPRWSWARQLAPPAASVVAPAPRKTADQVFRGICRPGAKDQSDLTPHPKRRVPKSSGLHGPRRLLARGLRLPGRPRLPVSLQPPAGSSARGPPGRVERGPVKHEPAVGDLAVGNGDALGGGCALDGHGFGVVHDQRGLPVAEGGDQLRAGEDLHERAHEAPVGIRTLQAASWRVADEVIGDVAHGLVQVVTGPGLEVGQCNAQRRAGGLGHDDVLPDRERCVPCCLYRHRGHRERNAAAAGRREMSCWESWSRPCWSMPGPAMSRRSASLPTRTAANCRCTATGYSAR